MLGTVQFSSLAGGGCVAGPGGGLKRHRCKRKKLEKQITLVVEPPEAAPWGRKAQRTPPIPGSELRDVTCTLLLQPHQLQSCLLPVRAEREILCQLLLKFPKKMVSFESKVCLRCKRTYCFISAMSSKSTQHSEV